MKQNQIEPRPRGVSIKIHKHASIAEAKAIAQQILDTITEAQAMPSHGRMWMTCRKCGKSVVDDPCYRVT